MKIIKLLLAVLCISSLVFVVADNRETIFSTFSSNDTEDKEKIPATTEVLFISSYSQNHITLADQLKGITKVLYSNGIGVDVEYMKMKEYPDRESIDAFTQLLTERMSKHDKYKAIILGDDAALSFGEEHEHDLFEGIPMVFLGVNDQDHAERAAADSMITGSVEVSYQKQIIELAMKLEPNAHKVAAVYDTTDTGIGDYAAFQKLAADYPDYEFIGVNASGMTRQELGNTVAGYDEDYILIMMDANNDSEGNSYQVQDSVQYVAAKAKIPTYRINVGGIGYGAVGQVQYDFEAAGEEAGRRALHAVNGESVGILPLSAEDSPTYCFDEELMNKFGLDMDLLPQGTSIANQRLSFFAENKRVILPVLIILLSLVVLMFLIYRDYAISHKNLQKLKDSQKDLQYAVDHDALTGLLNHNATVEALEWIIDKGEYIMFMMDVDDLKKINDTYGYKVGDEVIRQTAARMSAYTDANNGFVSKYGGDEFIMLFSGRRDTAVRHIQALQSIIGTPLKMKNAVITVHVSCGITLFRGEHCDINREIQNADLAMYNAKDHGKNGYIIFEHEMRSSVEETNNIRDLLLDAIEKERFYMVYQPQVSTDKKELSGFEALVRIRDCSTSPGVFIPIAEECGLISQIGRITTELVIKQIASWKNEGRELHPVSVNFSVNQLYDHTYLKFLEQRLKKYDVPAECVEIELTEGRFMENTHMAMELFAELKRIGVRILLDDFGTGYSSLSYLSYIPVDVIKIDKTMIDTYLNNSKLISDIIHMAHNLNKVVIAEGVEEEWQYKYLLEQGCDYIQGYYFSKPLPGREAIFFDPAEKK